MNVKPFLVWHGDDVIRKEEEVQVDLGLQRGQHDAEGNHAMVDEIDLKMEAFDNKTRRYIVWAWSRREAANIVQVHKLVNGRLAVNTYNVCSLEHGKSGKIIELSTDEQHDEGSGDDWDIECFESIFGSPLRVNL